MLTSFSYCQKGSFKVREFSNRILLNIQHQEMLLNSMKQSYTNSLVFHNYKTRKYLLKHHKLGPVQTFVTAETYRQELGQD